jgi:hypothetical protein
MKEKNETHTCTVLCDKEFLTLRLLCTLNEMLTVSSEKSFLSSGLITSVFERNKVNNLKEKL